MKCKAQKAIDNLIVSICSDCKASAELINTLQSMIKIEPSERLIFKDLDQQTLFRMKTHEPKQSSIFIDTSPLK